MPNTAPPVKKCFVIGPIGEEDSATRRGADWLLNGIVKKVLLDDPFNYAVERADQFADPGLITAQAINAAIEADLVIADLSNHNPNAFYELAIRHMEEKPVVHMIQRGQQPPFDLKDYRAISFGWEDPSHVEKAQAELEKQVKAIEAESFEVHNPITAARGRLQLERSSDPKDKLIADLSAQISIIKTRMDRQEYMQMQRIHAPVNKSTKLKDLIDDNKSNYLKLRNALERRTNQERFDMIDEILINPQSEDDLDKT